MIVTLEIEIINKKTKLTTKVWCMIMDLSIFVYLEKRYISLNYYDYGLN